jgi:hypothetical protein
MGELPLSGNLISVAAPSRHDTFLMLYIYVLHPNVVK